MIGELDQANKLQDGRAFWAEVKKCTNALIFYSLYYFIEYLFGICYIESITLGSGFIGEHKSDIKTNTESVQCV